MPCSWKTNCLFRHNALSNHPHPFLRYNPILTPPKIRGDVKKNWQFWVVRTIKSQTPRPPALGSWGKIFVCLEFLIRKNY